MASLCRSCTGRSTTHTVQQARSYITSASLRRLPNGAALAPGVASTGDAPATERRTLLGPGTNRGAIKVHPLLPGPPAKDPLPSLAQRLKDRYDPSGDKAALVSRSNPGRLKPGMVVSVMTYTNYPAESPVSTFSGYVMGISRSGGVETSVRLRNQVSRIGVEMRVPLFSPTVKEVRVVKAEPPKRIRRAKLYYMRQPKHDKGSVSNIVRQAELAKQAKR